MFIQLKDERMCGDVFKSFQETKGEAIKFDDQLANKADLQKWSGHDRICNSRWCSRCNCDSCYSRFQAETSRALGRNFQWDAVALKRVSKLECFKCAFKLRQKSGQSSVEFAIVAVVLILIVVGIGAVLGKLTDSTFLNHTIAAATNNISSSVSGAIDAFCF